MKRDVIVGKLIAEGLSEKTLVRLNDNQLLSLAERMLSEQMKKGSVVMSKTTSNPNDVKKLTDQGLNVELREKKSDTKEQEEVPLGTTPGLGDNPGSKELDSVKVTPKKIGRLETFKNDMKSSLSKVPNAVKPLAAAPAAVVNAVGGQIGFKGRSEKQKERGDLNRDNKTPVQENNIEVKKWVKGLVENKKFHSFTSKNEIMELIQIKINENKPSPSKPDTDTPVREKPTTKPGKPKRENPFEPKHAPKPKALGEQDGQKNKMPEFMKFKNLGFKFKDQN